MLTVRYDRLEVKPGERLLDLGSGAGRHTFEAMRLGAFVVAVDSDQVAVKETSGMMWALLSGEEPAFSGAGAAVTGDALRLPFPDSSFDRVIVSEVLEHINDDHGALGEISRILRPGGTMAATVPRWWPELVTWALSDEYHIRPGGHVRIYRRSALAHRIEEAGLRVTGFHHAHALHSPYWWLRAAVGVDDDAHPLVRAYHRFLVWDITAHTPLTRVPEALLNPVLGKSVVLYASKPS